MAKLSQKMNKIDHISVSDIQTIDFVQNNIEFNRVSIFFHEIFRINVELNFDLKFWNFELGQFLKNACQI